MEYLLILLAITVYFHYGYAQHKKTMTEVPIIKELFDTIPFLWVRGAVAFLFMALVPMLKAIVFIIYLPRNIRALFLTEAQAEKELKALDKESEDIEETIKESGESAKKLLNDLNEKINKKNNQ